MAAKHVLLVAALAIVGMFVVQLGGLLQPEQQQRQQLVLPSSESGGGGSGAQAGRAAEPRPQLTAALRPALHTSAGHADVEPAQLLPLEPGTATPSRGLPSHSSSPAAGAVGVHYVMSKGGCARCEMAVWRDSWLHLCGDSTMRQALNGLMKLWGKKFVLKKSDACHEMVEWQEHHNSTWLMECRARLEWPIFHDDELNVTVTFVRPPTRENNQPGLPLCVCDRIYLPS
eukprot:SAG22_NODE_78_length_22065_cov_7.473095_11_plen_229_part_00